MGFFISISCTTIMSIEQRKKRILMVGESSHIPSGFGNYTREILSRLYNTNKYEVAELSCYRHDRVNKTEPWKIYPVSVMPQDPLFNEFMKHPNNRFGQWRFDLTLLDFKPDIVIDIRDFWNFSYQEISPLRPFFKWVIAPTYDSDPPKIDTFNMFNNADRLLFHTDWAKDKYLSYSKSIDNVGEVVSDSVDPNIFKPLDTHKNIHKMIMGLPENSFIIGSVMRNQKRKLIPDLLQVLRQVINQNPTKNIILYLHSSFPEQNGWNIPSLLIEHRLENHVYLTYKCNKCSKYWASKFQGVNAKCVCGFNANICSVTNGISQDELNNIYNIFDIYIQYAICEGFGIPQVEAASAGIPVITVNHGAMKEVGDNIGAYIVNTIKEFKESETEAVRVYPDNNHCVSIIQSILNMASNEILTKSEQTRNMLLKSYSWEKTAKLFEHIIDNLDISSNLQWNIPIRASTNTEVNITSSDTNRDFIYKFIDQVIMDQHLKNTSFIEELIFNLDNGKIMQDGRITSFTRQHATKILEIYLNNKINIEKIRTKQVQPSSRLISFLNY